MEILIISGLSGGGKSKAASFLEDMGFYIVDNMPAGMILKFADFCAAGNGRYNRVALVYDVEPLGEGRFRLTTIEGNMAGRVKMYIHDYDMNAPDREKNLSEPPADAELLPETDCLQYDVPASTPNGKSSGKKYPYYVNCFLMPW